MTFHLGWNTPNDVFHIGWLPDVDGQPDLPALGSLSWAGHWEDRWRRAQLKTRKSRKQTRKTKAVARPVEYPVTRETVEHVKQHATRIYEETGLDQLEAMLAAINDVRAWLEALGDIADHDAALAFANDDEDAILAIMMMM